MEVETLGIARSLGWKVHMRCADGYREGTKSIRRCVYRKQLDLDTSGLHARPELPAFAPGVAAHVSGLRKSQRDGRVRAADQSRGSQRMTESFGSSVRTLRIMSSGVPLLRILRPTHHCRGIT